MGDAAMPDSPGLLDLPQRPTLSTQAAAAHYAFENDVFARRLPRLMLELVGRGRLPPAPDLILPRYVAAQTVRPPPGR